MKNIHSLSEIMNKDHRGQYACIRYILERCCFSEAGYDGLNTYKDMDFMQLKWILDRCNFLAGKWFGLVFFEYSLLCILEDTDLNPSSFDLDWNCDYVTDKYGYFKRNKKGDIIKTKRKVLRTYMDFISSGDQIIMDKVIRRWKLYGRFCQSISDWWWIKIKKAKLKA